MEGHVGNPHTKRCANNHIKWAAKITPSNSKSMLLIKFLIAKGEGEVVISLVSQFFKSNRNFIMINQLAIWRHTIPESARKYIRKGIWASNNGINNKDDRSAYSLVC